jgi:hypothetical protein
MKQGGIFTVELKRQIDDELLSGICTPAQLTNHHELSSVLRYYYKEQCSRGRCNNEPSKEAAQVRHTTRIHSISRRFTSETTESIENVQIHLPSFIKKVYKFKRLHSFPRYRPSVI